MEIDAQPAGPAPSESVMVLLCGLASRGECWSARDEIAKKLYPTSDRERRTNALRQSIFRLRQWLNVTLLEIDGDRIRLRPGAWQLDYDFDGEQVRNAAHIAPGLNHPWIDEIRYKLCPAPAETQVALMKGFTESVLQIATFDPSAARGLFVSAANLVNHFSMEDFTSAVNAVRPQSESDHHAADFYSICAWMAYRNGLFDEATRQARLAMRSKPSRKVAVSMASMFFYTGIERCDERGVIEAKFLLDQLKIGEGFDTVNMCLYWNLGAMDEAILARDRALASIDTYSRRDKLTYWINTAYFNADIGDATASEEALAEANTLVSSQEDNLSLSLLRSAQAKMHLLKREADEAQKAILDAKAASQRFGRLLQDIYVLETQSEVSAALGHYERAKIEWTTFLRRRKSLGLGICNRLQRQQTRILV